MSKVWLKKETKWTDKRCAKHKHDFSERVIVHVSGSEPSKHYFNAGFYTADKCRHCNSFINAEWVSEIPEDYRGCEVYEFISHKQMLGFDSITPAD